MENSLYNASASGDVNEVRRILRGQVNVNAPIDFMRRTALFMACRNGHLGVVEALISDPRIDIYQPNDRGTSPLSISIENGHGNVSKYMIEYKRNTLRISPESEVLFVKNHLSPSDPKFPSAIAALRDLHENPSTRDLAMQEKLVHLFVDCFDYIGRDQLKLFNWAMSYLSRYEAPRSELLKLDCHCQVMRRIIQYGSNSGDLLLAVRLYLSRSLLIRDRVANEVEGIFEYLTQNFEGNWLRVEAAGIILLLLPHYHGTRSTSSYLNSATNVIFQNLRQGDDQSRAFDALIVAAAQDTGRRLLSSINVMSKLTGFLGNPNTSTGFSSCLIQALLSATDVDASSQSTPPTPSATIQKIMSSFDSFVNSKITYVTTTDGYFAESAIMFTALRSLATNEGNLRTLRDFHIVRSVCNFFRNRKEDLLMTNRENLQEAANLVWTLSFDRDCQTELISEGMVQTLKSFSVNDHAGVKKAISGALWNLTPAKVEAPKSEAPKSETPKPEAPKSEGGYVMISYCWSQKEKMRQVASYFKEKGISIWLDIEQMEGSVLERMSEAVENAAVIVIGLSSNYKESQACRTEAEYSFKLKKNVVYLMAEDGYVAKGWLGAMLGNKLWYNPWGSANFDSGMQEVLSQVKKMGAGAGSVSGTASNVAQASSSSGSGSNSNSNPEDWGVDQVTEWLAKVGLNDVAKKANESQWDGLTLKGLYEIRKDASFGSFCQDLGVSDRIKQLRLVGALSNLHF